MTDECISPLRRRMIEDMTVRNFVVKTQTDYIRRVESIKRVVDALQCAVIGPQIEIVVDRAFRRQVFRDCAPLTAARA
jgi:hypothetical protein